MITKFFHSKKIHKKKLFLISFAICMFFFIVIFKLAFPYFDIGTRHLLNVAFANNLHEPLLIDNYNFGAVNYTKKYDNIKFNYMDEYSVGMRLINGNLPSSFSFDGKIKVEIYKDNKLIAAYTSDSGNIKYHKVYKSVVDNILEIDKVSLVSFDVPILKKYSTNLSIKVSVINPDKRLKLYEPNLQLYIGIDRLL
jgi:hypothetical protein